ncbi:MAG: hypothetical protein U1D41_12835 [Nitrosomonas sp.]|uniref:hypothetical protein n=2 Tax=Nitrosomonas sp. TaxID=42353 RepID=UPI0027329789|nr:hypothetical protein [Nitrosomonas sp.]MDP3663037.1 hypothetical protein [Nitrosomonas sp.]MDZ4107014.1 hypothetical protein [Nitrosomonas sp.]
MIRRIIPLVLLSAIVMLSQFAWAHTDEYLAKVETLHGGQLRAAGPFHLELVAKDGELTLYVTDHGDNPVPVQGGHGKANIQAGKDGERKAVTLVPENGNIMRASGAFKITPETSVTVFIAIPGHEAQGVRFTPLAPKGDGGSRHDHDH